MRQGIQTNFPHKALREYGCYFFCLCQWAEIISGTEFTDDEIIAWYDSFVSSGMMEEDCFVIDPPNVLTQLLTSRRVFYTVTKTKERPREDIFVVYLKKPGHGHFVLNHNGATWDSLDPQRPGATGYQFDSYRAIV